MAAGEGEARSELTTPLDLGDLFRQVPAPIALVSAPDQRYLLANLEYRRRFGGRDLIGRSVQEAHPELAGQAFLRGLETAMATGEAFEARELRVVLDRGAGASAEGWFNVVDRPVLREDGSVESVMIFALDVTEEVQVRRRAEESLAFLDTIIESAPTGFALFDRDLRYVRVNEVLARINGVPAEAHVGRTLHEIVPDVPDETLLVPLRRVLETGEPVVDLEVTGRTRAGSEERSWLASYYPVRAPGGEIAGLGALVVETTEHRRAERRSARLRDVLAALATALDGSEVCDAVLRHGAAALGAVAGSVALLGEEGAELVTEAMMGYDDEVANAFPRYPADADLPMTDALRSGPVWLESDEAVLARYPHLATFRRRDGHQAVAAVPLIGRGGRAIGGLAFSFPTVSRFPPEERAFVMALAGVCSQALERAHAYGAAEEARARAEAAAGRDRLMARASETLDAALGYEERLGRLVRVVVPQLADLCVIDMLDERGRLRTLAVAHREQERTRALARARKRLALPPDAPFGVARVIATGEPHLVEDVPAAFRELGRAGAEAGAAAGELGISSAMFVPLRARGRVLGTIALASVDPARRYGPDDLQIAERLGRRAGLAVDNARLYEGARAAAAADKERAGRLRALSAAALSINARMSIEHRLQAIAESARELAGARWATASVTDDDLSATATATSPEGVDPPRTGSVPALSAPLRSHGGAVIGVIEARDPSAGEFGEEDEALLAQLAQSASLALDNVRLYERERHIARTLQESLLPSVLPEVPGLEVAARYAAAGAGTEVGGDLYDVFHSGQSWNVVIGDVCGKGAEAAALTALVRYTLRAESGRGLSPRRSLELLNEAILRQHGDNRFCTVLLATVEQRPSGVRLTFGSGGHPPPLVLRGDGAVERVTASGTVLGVFPDPKVEDRTIDLAPGDVVLLYTDGIVEARTEDGLFGDERLVEELRAAAGLDAEATAQRVVDAVLARPGVRVRDDIAVLALRVAAAA